LYHTCTLSKMGVSGAFFPKQGTGCHPYPLFFRFTWKVV
jgi:hypothetical protein